MTEQRFFNPSAGTLNIPTDVRMAVGKLVGPNTLGEYKVIDTVDYDPETGRSVATLRFATPEDLEAAGLA